MARLASSFDPANPFWYVIGISVRWTGNYCRVVFDRPPFHSRIVTPGASFCLAMKYRLDYRADVEGD